MAEGSHESGTIKVGKKFKFPTTTKGRARNAMARINQAKPKLTSAERKKLARAVERQLGHSTVGTRRILGT
jgi:hypothetical protein